MDVVNRDLIEHYGLVVGPENDVAALDAVGSGSLTLVSLFALRAEAQYDDGTTSTGVEAMLRYSAASGGCLAAVGGRFVAQALPTGTIWGEDESWDVLVVAEYPSTAAFWALLADPAYRSAYVHRTAAVARQRVTAAVPLS